MALKNMDDQKMRARLIVQKIIVEGKTQKQAAKELGISHDTVARGLALARQANIYVEYSQKLYDELVPLAYGAVKLGLEDGDSDLGLKILQATNIAKTNQGKSKSAEQEEDDLYGEIARLREGSIINVSPAIEARTKGNDESNGDGAGGFYGAEEAETPESQNCLQDVVETIEGESK